MNGLQVSRSLEDTLTFLQEPLVDVVRLAQARLRNTPYSALRQVQCEITDGALVLRGCLPSYFLKQMAQEVLAEHAGILGIDNRIQVEQHAPAGSN
jgi:hypothetical protein